MDFDHDEATCSDKFEINVKKVVFIARKEPTSANLIDNNVRKWKEANGKASAPQRWRSPTLSRASDTNQEQRVRSRAAGGQSVKVDFFDNGTVRG
ncbi:hypothetical protein EIP86_010509 [Pleurotus ostreatoroseus]|nr:hypothetical protein EIP86_010509 [Pleurotus ostreatoroseus]